MRQFLRAAVLVATVFSSIALAQSTSEELELQKKRALIKIGDGVLYMDTTRYHSSRLHRGTVTVVPQEGAITVVCNGYEEKVRVESLAVQVPEYKGIKKNQRIYYYLGHATRPTLFGLSWEAFIDWGSGKVTEIYENGAAYVDVTFGVEKGLKLLRRDTLYALQNSDPLFKNGNTVIFSAAPPRSFPRPQNQHGKVIAALEKDMVVVNDDSHSYMLPRSDVTNARY